MNKKHILIASVSILIVLSVFAFLSLTGGERDSIENISGQVSVCSASLSVSLSGIDSCSVSAAILSRGCQGKSYDIANVANCSGTVNSNEEIVECNWNLMTGDYTYDLSIGGSVIDTKTLSCLSSDAQKTNCTLA
jgi:hypothetical protein